MKIAYARVSTAEQNLDRQLEALKQEGYDKIFIEKRSTSLERKEREKAFNSLKEGDTLVFLDLDRVFRSLTEALTTFEQFEERGITFKCLNNPYLNTSEGDSQTGKVLQKIVRSLIAGFAEMEKAMIRERTMAGLARARAKGNFPGRPGLVNDPEFQEKVKKMLEMYDSGEGSFSYLCNMFNVKPITFYRAKRVIEAQRRAA